MRCVRARILAQRCEEGAGENVRVFARRREVLDVVGDLDVGCLNVVGDPRASGADAARAPWKAERPEERRRSPTDKSQ